MTRFTDRERDVIRAAQSLYNTEAEGREINVTDEPQLNCGTNGIWVSAWVLVPYTIAEQ